MTLKIISRLCVKLREHLRVEETFELSRFMPRRHSISAPARWARGVSASGSNHFATTLLSVHQSAIAATVLGDDWTTIGQDAGPRDDRLLNRPNPVEPRLAIRDGGCHHVEPDAFVFRQRVGGGVYSTFRKARRGQTPPLAR